MTQEEKQLLLVDLCARLPYDVRVNYEDHIYVLNEIDPSCKDIDYITARIQDVERLMCAKSVMIEDVKPYLRSMSSMTDEEEKEFEKIFELELKAIEAPEGHSVVSAASSTFEIDFYNKHHFDYRGLIEKGLVLEAPKDMYSN